MKKKIAFIITLILNVAFIASVGAALGAVSAYCFIHGGGLIAVGVVTMVLLIGGAMYMYGDIKAYFKEIFAILQ